jgi:hypothetical protein
MPTLIFIENAWGSSQIVELTEQVGDYQVHHRLLPGENVRIPLGRVKSVSIREAVNQAFQPKAPFKAAPPRLSLVRPG